MENFVIRLKLAMVTQTLQQVLPTFSNPAVIESTLITSEVQQIQKNQYNILAQISFGAELKINLHVLVASVKDFSLAATKYNMAMAHGCAVSFNLLAASNLEVTLTPPNEEIYKKLCTFYQQFC